MIATLARELDCPFWTADHRLYEAARSEGCSACPTVVSLELRSIASKLIWQRNAASEAPAVHRRAEDEQYQHEAINNGQDVHHPELG